MTLLSAIRGKHMIVSDNKIVDYFKGTEVCPVSTSVEINE